MNKEIISSKQGITLLILFLLGSTVVIGTGRAAKKDLWIAIIIAIIMAVPALMMYAKLLSMFPQKDLFQILELVFGKVIGRIFSLFFIWFALHLGALVLYNFGEYIRNVGLSQTPRIVFKSLFMILCVWGVKEGIEVLGRWGEILLPFLVFIIFMAVMLSIPSLRLKNILPVFEEGIKPVVRGAFFSFTFPFAETIIFTMIFSCFKDRKQVFKVYILGLLLGGIFIFIISLRNIMVLGSYIISMSYFPSFAAVARINIGHFLQRLESAVSISFLISGYVKISMCLLGASKGISRLFNCKDYRFIVIPTALIILSLTFIAAGDMMELTRWNSGTGPYYFITFEVILPLIVFICAKIRYKKLYSRLNSI